jgi:hypothetical protein
MKKVVIRAPLLSISGYGEHSRQVYKYLLSRQDLVLSTQVVQWGNTAWMIDPEGFDGIAKKVMDSSSAEPNGFDVSFQVQLPDEWDSTLASFNIGVTAGVETDICSQTWIESINKMDLVIVPSSHVRDTFLRTGNLTTQVIVIGEWYQEELDMAPLDSILNLKFDTNFNFLVVSQLTAVDDGSDRKNILNTIKWFCEVFKDDKDVGLILKTNLGRGTHIDRMNVYHIINSCINTFRTGPYPRIHVLHGNMTDHEISSLYRHPSIKCFISLTRGEGFGLPILDASIAQIPVITTNWSGHLDFMKLGKFIAVDYDMLKIPDAKIDKRIFVENSKWSNPKEEDFKKRLLKFRTSYTVPKQWALELSDKCKEKFSRQHIEKIYETALSGIL